MGKLSSVRMIKLFSVIIAVFLWFFAMSDINPTRSKEFTNIKVNSYGLREGLVITDDITKTANIVVTGKRNEIAGIDRNDFDIDIDLSKYGTGKHEIKLYGKENIGMNNLKVEYKPEYTTVNIERLMNRTYDIELIVDGKLPNDIDKNSLTLTATTCSVSGAESKVKTVSRILARVDAKQIDGKSEVSAAIEAVDKHGKIVKDVSISRNSINVIVPFEKSYPVLLNPVTVGDLDEEYEVEKITVTPETVNIKKESESVEEISSVNTVGFDISGLTESTEKNVAIEVPQGYTIVGNKTAVVKVKIRKKLDEDKKNSETEFKSIAMSTSVQNVMNLDSRLKIANPDEIQKEIVVEIEGSKEVVDAFTKEGIQLSLDFSSATEPGNYNVPVNAIIKSEYGVKIKSVKPDTITVTMSQ